MYRSIFEKNIKGCMFVIMLFCIMLISADFFRQGFLESIFSKVDGSLNKSLSQNSQMIGFGGVLSRSPK